MASHESHSTKEAIPDIPPGEDLLEDLKLIIIINVLSSCVKYVLLIQLLLPTASQKHQFWVASVTLKVPTLSINLSSLYQPTDRFFQVLYNSSPSQTRGVSRLSLSSVFILPLVSDRLHFPLNPIQPITYQYDKQLSFQGLVILSRWEGELALAV